MLQMTDACFNQKSRARGLWESIQYFKRVHEKQLTLTAQQSYCLICYREVHTTTEKEKPNKTTNKTNKNHKPTHRCEKCSPVLVENLSLNI